MRHARLALLCAAALALLFMSYGTYSKLDVLILQQETTMPEPDETTMTTSWCYKTGEPAMHTRIDVATTRLPHETPAEHKARHEAAVAAQILLTPNNCQAPGHPL